MEDFSIKTSKTVRRDFYVDNILQSMEIENIADKITFI